MAKLQTVSVLTREDVTSQLGLSIHWPGPLCLFYAVGAFWSIFNGILWQYGLLSVTHCPSTYCAVQPHSLYGCSKTLPSNLITNSGSKKREKSSHTRYKSSKTSKTLCDVPVSSFLYNQYKIVHKPIAGNIACINYNTLAYVFLFACLNWVSWGLSYNWWWDKLY